MESDNHYGPALPPGMVASSSGQSESVKSQIIIGPSLPPGMQKSSDSDDLSDEGPLTVKMDPEMSPEYSNQDGQDEIDDDDDDDENDDETVGPMPSEMSQGVGVVQVAEDFEQRAKRMKDQLTTVKAEAEEGPSKREEWMTELPPEMSKNFGLQNRQFSKGHGGIEDKDRSSWTEIAGVKNEHDSMNKGKKRKREDEKIISVRDQQLHQQVEEYNKSKRPDSLMDMHSKKQKKKKKKEKKEKKKRKERGEKEEKASRRPFDRDTDLKVNRFDDAQRKSIIKKSQVLNTRFSKGATTSHFL